MVLYRRNFVPGGTYFFTVTLADRRAITLVDHVENLRTAYQSVVSARSIDTIAICVLPDHLHAVWTMPDGDANFSSAWVLIKARFSRAVAKVDPRIVRVRNDQFNLWQSRFWEHTIRDDRDLEAHVNYIHFNPAKHGYCTSAAEWPHSSFHRYVREGLLTSDWAVDTSIEARE